MIYTKGDLIGGKYQVHRVLGEGGLGIVYLVYAKEVNEVYALKTFRNEYLENKNVRERFRKEAKVWVDLEKHPYIVRAHFIDEISDRLFILMDHIAPDEQGLNTLDGYLRRNPPDLIQTLKWAIQFCNGMEYAYTKGIKAHRDIKPSNIMVDSNKNVKISDFGLAGIIDTSEILSGKTLNNKASFEKTVAGSGFGTPAYMAPEQFIDASSCDERSDIYSLGVVLYQMATGGKLPFYTGNKEQFWWIMQNLHNKAPVPRINSFLSTIIYRCLEKKPNDRYHSFNELLSYIEKLYCTITGSKLFLLPNKSQLESWELFNKGVSLSNLGFFDEAIDLLDSSGFRMDRGI